MFHFYNPLKRQKTKAFVTFSGDKTQVKITRLFILRRGITREHLHTCATSSGAKKSIISSQKFVIATPSKNTKVANKC